MGYINWDSKMCIVNPCNVPAHIRNYFYWNLLVSLCGLIIIILLSELSISKVLIKLQSCQLYCLFSIEIVLLGAQPLDLCRILILYFQIVYSVISVVLLWILQQKPEPLSSSLAESCALSSHCNFTKHCTTHYCW